MASTSGRTRKGWMFCVLTTWVCILGAQTLASETVGYQYQTRRTRQPLSVARQQHAALKLGNGKIGIFGGFLLSSVEVFDPNTEVFTLATASRWFANFSGVALLDGNALLVDGEHDCTFDYVTGQYVDTVNTYSAGVARWAVPVLLPDGKVFLCGGCDSDFNVTGACVVYDPRARRFTSCGRLQVARSNHTAVLLDDDHVLIIGGYDTNPSSGEVQSLDSLEVFDLKAGTSALVRTPLRVARYDHCSIKLADNRVLILGGVCWPKDLFTHSTEIFDPRTSTMVDGPNLIVGREGARTAVMPSGRIAVFGGQYNEQTIELYDPNTASFSLAGCLMYDPRWTDFTATSLNSGAVLIAGGRINDSDQILPYAEIFEEIPIIAESQPKSDAPTSK
jgi:hypothetical protein